MIGAAAILLMLAVEAEIPGSIELSPGALWEYAGENSYSLEALTESSISADFLADAAGRLPDPTLRIALSPIPVETRNGPVGMTLTAHQMIPWPGLLSAQRNAAELALDLAELDSEIGGWTLRVGLTSLWGDMYTTRMEIEYLKGQLDRLDALLVVAAGAYETGTGNITDLLLLENRMALTEVHLSSLELESTSLEQAMNSMLGRPLQEPFHWPDSLPSPEHLSPPEAADDAAMRPMVRASELLMERSEASERLAAARLLPSLEMGATWSFIDHPSVEMGAVDPGRDALMLFAGFSLPLGWSGAAAGRDAQAHSAAAAALVRMQTVSDAASARSELDSSLQSLLMEYAAYESIIVPNLESLLLVREGEWVTGLVTLDRLLDSEDQLYAAGLRIETVYSGIVETVVQIMALEGLEPERGEFL